MSEESWDIDTQILKSIREQKERRKEKGDYDVVG